MVYHSRRDDDCRTSRGARAKRVDHAETVSTRFLTAETCANAALQPAHVRARNGRRTNAIFLSMVSRR
jgi:hypothetical protein